MCSNTMTILDMCHQCSATLVVNQSIPVPIEFVNKKSESDIYFVVNWLYNFISIIFTNRRFGGVVNAVPC